MDSAEPNSPEPRVRLDQDGVLCIDFSGRARLTRDAVAAANRLHRALGLPGKQPVLTLGERAGRVDYAAQRYASSAEVCERAAAMALVTRSFLQRRLARMFLMYHRPSYPVQVFADEPTARAWFVRHGETAA